MRSGVDRAGQHLYPTFPYDHFTNVNDEDDRALYAFLMTRPAVRAAAPANDLAFPFNQRFAVAGWKLLFLKGGTYKADSTQSAEWNRGAYLVDGLAHCGACHTPRNALGAEKASASFSGGDVDNWHAYAINAQSRSPLPWTTDALFHYLRQGWDPDHGVARGPMAEVTANLSSVPENDVRAIALYMGSVFGPPTQDHLDQAKATRADIKSLQAQPASADNPGALVYQAACATCHESGRPLPYSGINLRLSTALSAPDPRNAANIILSGIRPVGGERSPIMPGFANSMTDDQMAAVLNYLRGRFSAQPAWSGVEQIVRDARHSETVSLQTAPAPESVAGGSMQRDKP
jgi:mono/diheme cytochrome c family protein